MRNSKNGPSVSLFEAWAAFEEERLGHLSIKTQENYRGAARLIPAGRKAINSYLPADVYKLIKHLRPGAYMVARGFLSSLFSFAIRRGWAASNPVAYVETRKLGRALRWPREVVYGALSIVDDEEARLALETMYASGQRLSDVLSLKPSNFSGNVIKLVQKKTGNLVEVPISENLTKKLLARSLEPRQTIFQIKDQRVWRLWRKAKAKQSVTGNGAAVDLTKLRPHGLRKSASCEAAEGGASEAELQAFLGHRTPRAAALYRLEANGAILAASAVNKRSLSDQVK